MLPTWTVGRFREVVDDVEVFVAGVGVVWTKGAKPYPLTMKRASEG
jgi:hypothetical protein